MRSFCLAVVSGLVASLSTSAYTQPVIEITGSFETDEALYFQPADPSLENIVFFFPKLTIEFGPYRPNVSSAWSATLDMREVTQMELGALRPDWEGKLLKPYTLRPTTECELTQIDEMQYVNQLIHVKDRDVTYPQDVPVCQYTFLLPSDVDDAVLAALTTMAKDGVLITRDIALELVENRVVLHWGTVYDVLADILQPGQLLEEGEAAFLIAVAVVSLDVEVDLLGMSDETRGAFIRAGLEAVFDEGQDGYAFAEARPATSIDISSGATHHDF